MERSHRKEKPIGHHTDDCVVLAVQHEITAEHMRIARESPLPDAVTNENDLIVSCLALSRKKSATDDRLHSDQAEEISPRRASPKPVQIPYRRRQ